MQGPAPARLYRVCSIKYKPQALRCLWFFNKGNYIPQNLVEEVFVSKTEDYIYSSNKECAAEMAC